MINENNWRSRRMMLWSLLTGMALLTYACQQEYVDPLSVVDAAIEDSPAGAGSWSDIFWEGFNSSSLSQWNVTNRDDYNSSKCNYQSGQVQSGVSVDGKKSAEDYGKGGRLQ